MNLENFELRELLTIVFEWSYKNNRRLYQNLDDIFSAFNCRNAVEMDRRNEVYSVEIDFEKSLEILKHSITLCDYHDTLRFNWVFKGHGRNRTDEYHYDSFKVHEYSVLFPFIDAQLKKLEFENLADWHKSKDVKKHNHFRFWMNKFLTDENKTYFFKLLHQSEGNLNVRQILNLGTNNSESFKPIFKFILDEFIIPNPHYDKIEVQDFINPDYDNPKLLKKSGKFGGFWYLVYLTTEELMQIYKTLNLRKLSDYEKANWVYIKSLLKNSPKDKFYIWIT